MDLKFNNLTLVKRLDPVRVGKQLKYPAVFKCDCGSAEKVINYHQVSSGKTISCGCLALNNATTLHGDSGKRIYLYCYLKMLQRSRERLACGEDCKVFEPWLDYLTWKEWAMSNGYSDDLVLCRNGDTGDYHPNNVRFDTKGNNTREALSKDWLVKKSIDSEWIIVHNLSQFCKDNKLHQSALCRVANGLQIQHKGWVCKYKV